MFIEYEKELDYSNQMIKSYETNTDDNEMKKDISGKVCGDNIKEVCCESDDVYKTISINRFEDFKY